MSVYNKFVTPARLAYELSQLRLSAVANLKSVRNLTNTTIPIFKAVAWLDDGSVIPASALTSSVSDLAGITMAAILSNTFGIVNKGGNITNALVGLNATPGQYVFLGLADGELTLTAPSENPDAAIIKLGRAEPAPNSTTGIATDLFFAPEDIAGI